MKQTKRLVSILTLTILLSIIIQPSATAVSLSGLKRQLSETASRISHIQSNLRQMKKKQKTAADQLAVANRRLDVAHTNLNDIRSQLRATNTKLSTTSAKLNEIQSRLDEKNQQLAARIAFNYKHGSMSYLTILLGAADFWDLLSQGYVVRKILQSDMVLIESIKKDKQAVEEYKNVLETQKQKRARLERQQTVATIAANHIAAQRTHILRDANRERARLESELAAFRQQSSSIAAMVRRMQQSPEGRKRFTSNWHGSFQMPVAGRITSPFGRRYHPILHHYSMHTGTDIAAPYGTTIHAAASGYVASCGYKGAYGNTVVIIHSRDVSTFYGHCSSFIVRAGTNVKKGQAIARVGSTGLSTGPHVHFEVQKNGVSVSPY